MPLRRWLTNLQKSPLAMMLVAAGLLLALIQTEVRLQVAAYWETHPTEWRTSVAYEARDPGAVDFLTARAMERQKVLVAQKEAASRPDAIDRAMAAWPTAAQAIRAPSR